MKICVAQTRPSKGDIPANIAGHKKFIALALELGADLIVFPELSLTGYEPELANALASHPNDPRLDDFQTISDTRHISIGVGIPTRNAAGICISMILFQPQAARQCYSKKYLHADEEPFFISGQNFPTFKVKDTLLAPAICYEMSIPAHAETAVQHGAAIYLASVVKSVAGIDKALQRLSDIARKYSMPVVMANSVGQADGDTCAGKSSVWNARGELLEQLDEEGEGVIVLDVNTSKTFKKSR